jgi:hypothetical protein
MGALIRSVTWRVAGRAVAAGLVALAVAPLPAAAQFVSTSSIDGTVTDESGAALPGVTVTLTSPALQVPQIAMVTSTEGRYRFTQLPAGIFQARFELTGFQSVIRGELEVAAGFAAKVDIAMKIGSLEETITVSGASPIVDVTSTAGAQTLTPEMVNNLIPGSRMYGDMARMIPGLVSTSAPNIGRLGLGSSGSFSAYGDNGLMVLIDGFEIRSNTYPDFGSAQEIDVKSFGNSADIAESGSVWNLVSKSGGNQFHGRYAEQYINDKFQSNNLDDKLRSQGLSFGDSVVHYSDFNSDLGGKIVQDKLWFYGNFRDRRNKRSVAGLALSPGADNVYGTGDETPHLPVVWTMNWTGKLSYQPSAKYQFVAFVARDYSINDGGAQSSKAAQRFIPYESATYQLYPVLNFRGEFRATLRDNLLLNVQLGRMGYTVTYLDTPSDHSNNTITARWDRETGIFTGGSVGPGGNYAEAIRPRTNTVSQANLTYLPKEFLGGGHEFKIGYRVWLQEGHTDVPDHPAGNYQLTYDRVGGLAHQPAEITTFNFPVYPSNRENSLSGYINDHWQIGRRLTLNLGVRFDYDHSFLPEQTKDQGQFGNAGSFARFEGNTWKDFAPRTGVAWDITGDGKTVVKATYGVYNNGMADTQAQTFNQNAVYQAVYRWRDLNGNDNYDTGEVNLDLNGPDFISTTAAANNVFNPDLQRPQQHEVTAVFDRELMANMAGRVAYVYKRNVGDISTLNISRPYSAYDIPLTRRDPGPDGNLNTADDGGRVTIYDYNAAYRGAAFVANQQLNRPSDRSNDFHTMEMTLNKRISTRWGASTSFTVTKNHRWLASTSSTSVSSAMPQSPNDDLFAIDNTWTWGYKVSGSYRLPYDFNLSGVFDVQPGVFGQRTYVFRSVDPDGGTPLRQLSTVTMRLEPYGSQRGPLRPAANLRLSKFVKLPKGQLQVSLDALNAFNTNTFWEMTFLSGPTFGYGTAFTSPRALQFGATYEF